MSETLTDLTKLFNSRGRDGLSRNDRERMSNYKRRDFLFEKFLKQRESYCQLELKHEHILILGDQSMKKIESNLKKTSAGDQDAALKREINKIEAEVEQFKIELKKDYEKMFIEEKIAMKNSYETLMKRIEKQRDEAEEERMKELVRKMNEECEIALMRQWEDAEELRKKSIEEMREIMRKEIHDEMESYRLDSIKKALEEAEKEFLKRELIAIEKTKEQCEKEANEKIRILTESYDASIEILLQKLKESEERWTREKNLRNKYENDFRLLQADYKRFMNYTNHYNSDYMMKLRHIGQQVLEDKEFEEKLNEKIEIIDVKPLNKRSAISARLNSPIKKPF